MSISGKLLAVTIGATTVVGSHTWSCEEFADELDATTGADAGFETSDFGVYGARISIEFWLDVTTGLYSYIRRGTILTNLKLWLSSLATNPMFLFTTAKVFKSTPRGQVRDRFGVSVEAKGQGSYTQNEPN